MSLTDDERIVALEALHLGIDIANGLLPTFLGMLCIPDEVITQLTTPLTLDDADIDDYLHRVEEARER